MSDLNISKDQRKHISHTTIGEIVNVRQNVNAYEWMKGGYVCFVCASILSFLQVLVIHLKCYNKVSNLVYMNKS